MNLFTKTLTATAAALTLAAAFAPAAEARGGRGHGFHGGGHFGGHARPFVGHRFHNGHRRWAGVGVIGVGAVGYGGCIRYRQVYSPYVGGFVTRRVNVCL